MSLWSLTKNKTHQVSRDESKAWRKLWDPEKAIANRMHRKDGGWVFTHVLSVLYLCSAHQASREHLMWQMVFFSHGGHHTHPHFPASAPRLSEIPAKNLTALSHKCLETSSCPQSVHILIWELSGLLLLSREDFLACSDHSWHLTQTQASSVRFLQVTKVPLWRSLRIPCL